MNTLTILTIGLTAIGIMLTVLYRMLNSAAEKGATSEKINEILKTVNRYESRSDDCKERFAKLENSHEQVKSYADHHVESEKRFVKLEERKTDNKVFEHVRTDIAVIKGDILLMKDDILHIKRSIEQKTPAFQSSSPIRLTDTGKKIAEDTGIYKGVDANWPAIVSALDDIVTSNNPYDVQQDCFDFALLHLEIALPPEVVDALKLYAFNDGTPVSYFSRIVGLVIRDKYFEHKGLTVSDIDKHTPSKQ